MVGNFDPYREWLAVTTGGGTHNYYDLLGLRPLESDLGKINAAFRRQSDRLAPHLSGAQAAVAQRLMSELTEARMTLSTPTAKRAYDQSLAGGQPAAPPAAARAKKTARWSGSPAPESDDSLLPPTAMPAAPLPSATPVAPLPGPLNDVAMVSTNPAPVGQPAYPVMQPVSAPGYPYGGQVYPAPSYPAPAYAPGYPQGFPPHSSPAPYPGAPLGSVPAAAPAPSTPQVSTFSAAGYRAARRRRSSAAPLAAAVLLAVLVLLGGVYWKVTADRRLAAVDKQQRERAGEVKPRSASARLPKLSDKRAPRVARSSPVAAPKVAAAPPKISPEATAPEMPAPTKTASPNGEAPKSMPDSPSKPDDPAPEPNKSVASPEELAAVTQALQAARAALAARDMELAQEHIDQATLEATSPDTAAQVDRVELLSRHLDGFWEAARGTLSKLQAAEEIEIDGEVASVVDASAERLVFRAAGRNHDYSLATLPAKVALYLAKRWLAPDEPASNVALAAFHMVDPKGDRQEARRLLQSAAAGGIDVEPLLAELDAQKK